MTALTARVNSCPDTCLVRISFPITCDRMATPGGPPFLRKLAGWPTLFAEAGLWFFSGSKRVGAQFSLISNPRFAKHRRKLGPPSLKATLEKEQAPQIETPPQSPHLWTLVQRCVFPLAEGLRVAERSALIKLLRDASSQSHPSQKPKARRMGHPAAWRQVSNWGQLLCRMRPSILMVEGIRTRDFRAG